MTASQQLQHISNSSNWAEFSQSKRFSSPETVISRVHRYESRAGRYKNAVAMYARRADYSGQRGYAE